MRDNKMRDYLRVRGIHDSLAVIVKSIIASLDRGGRDVFVRGDYIKNATPWRYAVEISRLGN